MAPTERTPQRHKPDSDIVRHSYEQALIRLARLASYAEAGETKIDNHEVISRQNQLTIDDVIILSISTRRLLDVLKISNISSKIKICNQLTKESIDLRSTINKMIHSSTIKIVNFKFELISQADPVESYINYQNKEQHRISPLILVTSDTNKTIGVYVQDLCSACNSVLEAAADTSAKSGIYLELD